MVSIINNDEDSIYLIYLRKSRADNPDETVEEVLAKHEKMLQDHAIRLLGRRIEEKHIYREVVSGETIDDRPEVKRVLSLIENKAVKGLFVIEPQRLSRGDWEDGGKILSSFKYSETLVITPPKTYNLNDKFDYKFFKMELSQGNEYLEYTKEILKRGRRSSIQEGNYIGSVAPYGYKKIFIDKNPTIEPFEPEASTIQLAVEMYVNESKGWAYIARELDNMGRKPRKAKNWDPYTLRDICINQINIGKVAWDKRKEVKIFKEGKLKTIRPRNKKDPIFVKGKHDAILNDEIYNKMMSKIGSKTREQPSVEIVNPLGRLLFCGNCGRAMSYRTYKNKDGTYKSNPRLLCNNQVNCGTKSSEFSVVYKSVIDSLEVIVEDFEIKLENDESNTVYDLQSRMIKDAYEKLKAFDVRHNELYDFLEDKTYTKQVFLKREKKLLDEKAEVEKQLEYLENNIVEPINYKERIFKFKDVISALKSPDVSAKEKNVLLKDIIIRIDYFRDSTNRTKWDNSKPEIQMEIKDF